MAEDLGNIGNLPLFWKLYRTLSGLIVSYNFENQYHDRFQRNVLNFTQKIFISGKNREVWLSEGIFTGFIHNHIRICQDLCLVTPSSGIFHLSWLLFQEFHRNFAILLKTAAQERVMNHNNDLPGTKTFDWLDFRLRQPTFCWRLHNKSFSIHPPSLPPAPSCLPSIEFFSQENWLNATKQIDELY